MITFTKGDVIAMGSAMPVIDIIAVALRFYTKRRRGSSYGADDWLILISLIIACGCGAILLIGATTAGFGKSSPGVTAASGFFESDSLLTSSKKLTVCMNWIQLWTLGTSKLSVIFFYRTIFIGRTFRRLSAFMIGAVLIWTIGGFLGVAFQCGSHITLLWTSAATTKLYCRTGESVAFGFSIPDVVLDICILCMPIYWTAKLQMSSKKRLAVCGIFLFGALTVLASIVRLIIYIKLYPNIKENPNQIGVQTTIVYWSMLEIGLSIIAACLPTFWPLLARKPSFKVGYYLRTLLPGGLRDSNLATSSDRNDNPLFIPNSSAKQYCKIEGNAASIPERKSAETTEYITVTTGISRHESTEKMV